MSNKKIPIIFMGTSKFAAIILERLMAEFPIDLVVTTPDQPIGRKQILTPSPVKIIAQKNNLKLTQPEKIRNNNEFLTLLKNQKPKLIVVAAYGKILPVEIINLPEHGCLNVHASLLPKYRGASPIQTALLNGDKETGVTIILMDQGIDTGDIISQEKISISEDDNYLSLSDKLAILGADLLIKTIEPYIAGQINLEVQNDNLATYCSKTSSAMGKINWQNTAEKINNQIRALAQDTGVYTLYKNQNLRILKAKIYPYNNKSVKIGQVIKIPTEKNTYIVKCGQDALQLIEIQLAGKNPMSPQDFTNGHQDFIGTILT